MTFKKHTTNPAITSTTNSKGIDKMETTKPVFDLDAARAVTPTWNPLAFVTDYCTTLEEAKASQKPVKYIMGQDGIVYEMRSTEVGDFLVKANVVNGADTIREGFSLKIPKIPFKLLLQAVSFFRDVCDEFNNDEAMLQYWFDKETKEFFADCVQQTTNKVHVTFLRNKELEEDPNKVLVMDIHSHNNMNAFFSGTDDASEQETRTYGVIGKLDREIPEYKFRISVEGNFKEISVSDIFEMPKIKMFSEGFETEGEIEVANLFFPEVDYPKEWLEMIEEGKRSMSKFAGKGNRPYSTQSRSTYGNRPSDYRMDSRERDFRGMNADPFVDAGQLSIFEEDNYQSRALRNREGFGMDSSVEFEEASENAGFVDDFVEQISIAFDEMSDDSESKVQVLASLVSDFTSFEIKMLVDRMIEVGYDHEIIEQLRVSGYNVQR